MDTHLFYNHLLIHLIIIMKNQSVVFTVLIYKCLITTKFVMHYSYTHIFDQTRLSLMGQSPQPCGSFPADKTEEDLPQLFYLHCAKHQLYYGSYFNSQLRLVVAVITLNTCYCF